MKTKIAFDNALAKAMRSAIPEPVTQADIWANVRGDRGKLVAFVRDRTGAQGTDLTNRVYEYETEMKRRYG